MNWKSTGIQYALLLFSFVSIFTFSIQSCKKLQNEQISNELLLQDVKHPLTDKFFELPANAPAHLAKIAAKIRRDNERLGVVNRIINELGMPLWAKAINSNSSVSTEPLSADNPSAVTGADTIHTIIPIVAQNRNEVNAVLACRVFGDSVTVNLIDERNYKAYSFNNTSGLNATKVAQLMMYMQNIVFETEYFEIRDGRLFGGNMTDSLKVKTIKLKAISNGDNGSTSSSDMENSNANSEYTLIDVCFEECCYCGVLGQDPINCTTKCITYVTYTGGGSGSSTGSGGTGGSYDFGSGGTGGGSGSGSGGGTGFDDQNYNPVIPIPEQLRSMLGLSQDEVDFLNDNLVFTQEAWYYVNNSDGNLSDEQKAKLIRTHMQYAIQSLAYKNFSMGHYNTAYNQHGWAAPWFHNFYLSANNPALRANIVNLNLDAVQAYYLLNNLTINQEIKNFIDVNQGDVERVFASKIAIDASISNAFTSIDPELHHSIASKYLDQCCRINLILPAQYFSHLVGRMAVLKAEGRCNYFVTCYGMAVLELIQAGLDVVGLVPLVGEVADVANGIIYTISGDLGNASLSFAATIPIAGWASTIAKWAKKTITLADGTFTTLNWFKRTDGLISFGKPNSSQFRKLLGLAPGDPRQAHHIIPWELELNVVVQKAAQARFPFHMQDVLNGIPLTTAQHLGSHPNYTIRVTNALNAIPSKLGANYTPENVFNEIVNLTNRIKAAILANPNTPIDQIIF